MPCPKCALVVVWLALSTLWGCTTAKSKEEVVTQSGLRKEAPRPRFILSTNKTLSYGLDRIDQRNAQLDGEYTHMGTGKGVTIYVFDGGISPDHPELAGRVRVGFIGFPDDPKICNAHGTAVASAVAGSSLGAATEARIVDIKMVHCGKMRGTIKSIVDGVDWVIEDHERHPGPALVNWSFIADTSDIPALDTAVEKMIRAGMTVVVSAGNLDMDACRISPANALGVISVGAVFLTTDSFHQLIDKRSPRTAFGPCVDIYAPGDSVLLAGLDNDDKPITQLWNGTSMAAAYVSGAVALYFENHPNAAPDEAKRYVLTRATKDAVSNTRSLSNRLLYVGLDDKKP
ncbi:S8 family peptidase [Candidatus Parcubacteria bacterium]|nr:S8 family peptidase [Candidatus Parcubacteria bacterium]